MRIMIINPCNWYNKGDVTNRLGMIIALKREFKNAEIYLESSTPQEDHKYFSHYNVKVVASIYPIFGSMVHIISRSIIAVLKLALYAFIYKAFKKVPRKSLNDTIYTYLQKVISADLVISSAGGFLHDENILLTFFPQIFLIAISVFIGKTTIIYAQSIGPFRRKILTYIAALVFNRLAIIILREKRSEFWLKSMSLNQPKVYVTADATFSMPSPKIRNDGIIPWIKDKNMGKLLVGITVLGRWKGCNKRSFHNYITVLAEIIDYMIKNFDAKVILLPQSLSRPDINTMKKIYKLINFKDKVKLVIKDFTPEELMNIIGKMDLLIGTKLHSIIYALIMNVPVIAISYQPKTEGIMEMADLEEWVIPINSINFKKMREKVNSLLLKRFILKNHISEIVYKFRIKSLLSAKIVKEFWKSFS